MRWCFVLKKLIIIIVFISLSSVKVKSEELNYIEVFSIDEEKVVKTLPKNPEMQALVSNYIKSIDGIYGRFNPIPSHGYAVKVPLFPPVEAKSRFSTEVVDTVFIMLPKDDIPFLMIFENDNNLLCFTFKGDTDALIRYLNLSQSTCFNIL
jgi:hypothetical protein